MTSRFFPLRPRGDRPVPGRNDPVRQMLVAGGSHAITSLCRAWAMQIRKLWRSVGKACEWKHPRAPAVRLLFQDERATPVVLAFLRGTKIGRMVTLAPPEEED